MLLNYGTGEDMRVPGSARRSNHSIKPKGNQSWIFIEGTEAEAETPICWPPDAKNWLIGKDPHAGRGWRQEEKGTTDDEMVGWHHWLNGHEFEYTPGVGDGQGGLAYCSPWVSKSQTWLSDWTELNCFNDCLLFLCVYCDFFTNIVVSHFSVF